MSPAKRAGPLKRDDSRAGPAIRGARLHTNFLQKRNLVYMEAGPARFPEISLEQNGAPGFPG
jgi:hypothetical protein